MSFDLSWFTSAGGLLITGGVILLTIALVILIVTGKKPKKDKNAGVVPAENPVQVANAPVVMDPNMVQQNNVQSAVSGMDSLAMNGGMVSNPPVSSVPSAPVEAVSTPVVDPLANASMPTSPMGGDVVSSAPVEAVSMPTVDPMPVVDPLANASMPISPMGGDVVSSAPVEAVSMPTIDPVPVVESAPVMQTPEIPASVEQNSFESAQIPVVDPIAPVVDNSVNNISNFGENAVPVVPAVENVAMPSPMVSEVNTEPAAQPVVETPIAPAEPVIYGGASPIVPDINFNQNTEHQIYGGADPLQNTQTMPAVSPAPVEVAPPQPEVLVQPEIAPVAPIEMSTMPDASTPIAAAPVMSPTEPIAAAPVINPVAPVAPVVSVAPVAPVSPVQPQ